MMHDDQLPEGFKDALYVETQIFFDWKDRLRILFGYKVELRTQTFCEHAPGKTKPGDNRLLVYRPRPLPPGWGCVESKPKEQS